MLHEAIRQNFLDGVASLTAIGGVRRCGREREMAEGRQVLPALLQTDAQTLLANPAITEEVFGPAAIVVVCASNAELLAAATSLKGQLTASVHGTQADFTEFSSLLEVLERKAGRLVVNGFPTGVEVCPSMHHGGPYPATTDSRSTSVGTNAMQRFLRPVCYQNCPHELLPEALRDDNPLRLWRLVDGSLSREDL
jgi:NADP-dependent aldehyde dehydrogenase